MNLRLRLVDVCGWAYALWLLGGEPAMAQQDTAGLATVQYRTAVRAQNEGFYEQAATEWTDFIRDYPADTRIDRAYHYRGVCYLKLDKPAEAMADFQKVVSDYPQSELHQAAALYLGIAQYRLGQQGDAKMYDAALATLKSVNPINAALIHRRMAGHRPLGLLSLPPLCAPLSSLTQPKVLRSLH